MQGTRHDGAGRPCAPGSAALELGLARDRLGHRRPGGRGHDGGVVGGDQASGGSRRTRVRGALDGITLDLGGADAEIVGGRDEPVVEVRRTDRFSFGQPRVELARACRAGVLRLRSRCPPTVFGTCSASYRLTVPNNVPVDDPDRVGNVALGGIPRLGADRPRTAGTSPRARTAASCSRRAPGAATCRPAAACAPEQLELRSRTGDVRAVVPAGRYRIDAESDGGDVTRARPDAGRRRAVPDPGAQRRPGTSRWRPGRERAAGIAAIDCRCGCGGRRRGWPTCS